MQSNGISVILDLLKESVRQSGKAPHTHSHRQILPFDIAGAYAFRFRIAADGFDITANPSSRRISSLIL